MEGLLGEIVRNLRPDTLADFIVWTILILSLIQTFVTPSGNDLSNYMQFGTILLAIIDLLRNAIIASGTLTGVGLDNDGFATFTIRTLMFLLPLLIIGNVKSGKKKNQKAGFARLLAILTFLCGVTYWIVALLESFEFIPPILY